MAVAFTPLKVGELSSGGTTMPAHGKNSISNHSDSSPYTAPVGANYVLVSFDAATTITATPLYDGKGGQETGYSQKFLNAGETEITGVIGGVTVITTSQP